MTESRFSYHVFGVFDGGGIFWDYSNGGRVNLYFVRPPNRPEGLRQGWTYRLRAEGTSKEWAFYVDAAVQDDKGNVITAGQRG